MSITAEKLKEIREQIEQNETDLARAEGALKELQKRLKQESGCKNSKEIKTKLEKIQTDLAGVKKQIKKDSAEFEENYES